ncbi:MAG: fructosamine kinase family protein [Bifidobacteriaceae bacterium]|jgi:fructosamine-3-kinase|nr:fructosamine kinase family protein [Bifidobacteriaceae bacterium]
MSDAKTFIKRSNSLPNDFFRCEAAGLEWLNVDGGVRVAKVINVGDNFLEIERVACVSATEKAAYNFGKSLAHTHLAGTHLSDISGFGAAPDNWGKDGYFGPLSDPVKMYNYNGKSIADYLLNGRLLPMVEIGIERGVYTKNDLQKTEKLSETLDTILEPLASSEVFSKPARLHGDLWSGNVLWTKNAVDETEAVLIDPAAHKGCAEEDLAMLALFGAPYYGQIVSGYNSVSPLADGFESRINLFQLYPISGHAVFFGGSYISEYRSMLKRYL